MTSEPMDDERDGVDPQATGRMAPSLFEGDTSTLAPDVRRALTLLVSRSYLCSFESADDYLVVRENEEVIQERLNDLGLELMVSRRYEVAYARQAQLEAGNLVVLKRSVPLRRDATLLIVSIRARQHNDEARGEDEWFCDREDLRELLESGPYAGERDDTRVERALDGALRQLVDAGYLKETASGSQRYRIMPILPAVFTLERARDLLEQFAHEAGGEREPADDGGEG